MTIRSIMKTTVVTANPSDTLERANALMREYEIRHLPVFAGANLVGMVSDRDLALAGKFCGKQDQQLRNFHGASGERERTVAEVMSRNPVILRPDESLGQAARIAIRTRFGAFPVMERDRLVGLVSVLDLLEAGYTATAEV